MSESKQPISHDHLVHEITDNLLFNHGMVVMSVWQAHNSFGEEREQKLRLAAHYLGRALDQELVKSRDEIEWDEVSEPTTRAYCGKCEDVREVLLPSGKCSVCGKVLLKKDEPDDKIDPKDFL